MVLLRFFEARLPKLGRYPLSGLFYKYFPNLAPYGDP